MVNNEGAEVVMVIQTKYRVAWRVDGREEAQKQREVEVNSLSEIILQQPRSPAKEGEPRFATSSSKVNRVRPCRSLTWVAMMLLSMYVTLERDPMSKVLQEVIEGDKAEECKAM